MMAQLVEQRIRNAWVAGSARASQAWEAGSIPVSRSFFLIIKLNTNLL